MKAKAFRIISILLLVVLLLALGTAIAGAIAKSNLAKQYPAPGQLVDVGGYKMHINCTGQGSPTVILAAGSLEYSLFWALVQPEVAGFTRVCSYDRAGYGWSESSPRPRTATIMVEELHTLLTNGKIEGPYVLVGHSLGGMMMRVYAHKYPDEVAGLVLVDSIHEEQITQSPEIQKRLLQEGVGQFRMLALLSSTGIMALAPRNIPNPGLPDNAYAQFQATTATSGDFETNIAELKVMEESYAEVRALHITSFGNLPLIVLSAGREETIAFLSDAENQQRWEVWQALQSELVGLSSDSKQVIAEQSGHMIQLDQPDLVVDAIREVVDAIQK
jgi:pimeloyl-ACP methyl ester carboxylesterase